MRLLYHCLKCGWSQYLYPEHSKCPKCLVLMTHTWRDTNNGG